MSDLNSLIMEQLQWFIGGVMLLILILLVMAITQGAKLRKMRRKYDLMMEGSGVENLETLLVDLKVQMDAIEDEQEQQRKAQEMLLTKLQQVKGKVGIKRYNAFSDQGSDLSFSFAIVDEKKNGVVISALYSRDSSYVYAKPLAAGESTYALSPEEIEAISLAGQQG
ncbi:DUF4446 family protein [Paenibacillus azoreducens]|uniref:DUF4446 family protein n=1 Tax=Paenibacillus azoreducens TaxID=116718 RepID=A0A919YGD9_9BACL|nr:DUF4446 family protein [Paenibacillus azoreducens]GIO50176.1 hypothetical protein J34TS1_49410 [Paenibacillus azoreducens]